MKRAGGPEFDGEAPGAGAIVATWSGDALAAGEPGQPFFAYVHAMEVHRNTEMLYPGAGIAPCGASSQPIEAEQVDRPRSLGYVR
ncbi:MAG: hypothetical protein KBD01_00435 [Acidobacteria bacterium]|nr:hypothetical protein [Acidobacteriota bacterium]